MLSNHFEKRESGKAVFGIYDTRIAAESAIERFKMEGFRASDLSVLVPDAGGAESSGFEKSSKAPEGASTGAGAGLALGGTMGWLVGAGALVIPGVGPLLAAGPLIAMLAGAGAGAALGATAGGLIGAGIPEYEAKRYEGYLAQGKVLLSVHTDNADWLKRAQELMEATGADDISSMAEEAVPDPDHRRDRRGVDTSHLPPGV